MTVRINLWSSPRNVSTALMYSFARRPDTRVYDEPLYAHYLRLGLAAMDHPAQHAVLASMENDGEKVVRDLLLGPAEKPVLFFKQMTHHLEQLDKGFLRQMKNVLFIRHPREILASYTRVLDRPNLRDIGIPQAYDLCRELEGEGSLTAVLDARQLLSDPENTLRWLCERLEIPFFESMLSWPAGPRPEDGVWAPYWYGSVHQSTGFRPYEAKTVDLAPHLELLADQAMPFYEYLLNRSTYATDL